MICLGIQNKCPFFTSSSLLSDDNDEFVDALADVDEEVPEYFEDARDSKFFFVIYHLPKIFLVSCASLLCKCIKP